MKKQRKKILYVHHSGAYGGAPKSMSYIIKNLDSDIYDGKLINISTGPINDFFKKELPVPTQIVRGIKPFHGSTVAPKKLKLLVKNYLYLIPSFLNAYRIIKQEKPDLIHLNSTCLFVFSVAAKMLRIPVISHVREPLRVGFWGAPIRFFIKRSVDGLIAISRYDLRSLNLGKEKIAGEVIYNFVEDFYDGKPQKEFKRGLVGIDPDDIVFLYLARFAKGNGWEELISMAKSLTAANPRLHFVLAGADSHIDKRKYETKNIHIIPFQNDVYSLLQSSDIYVCPFTEPHFARGVIEASAFSLPIIGANIGGIDELVRDAETGFLYKSEEEFSKYALMLANDEDLRHELGSAGYKYAMEKFNMDRNLRDTYDFYEKILSINSKN